MCILECVYGDCMQTVNVKWSDLFGLDLLTQKVAGAEGEPSGPAGLWGQRFGAVHGPRAVTRSGQTHGHITCLPACASSSCQPCCAALAVHPLSHHSFVTQAHLRSPSLPATTLKKGPPRQISVSNPRWKRTFFNWHEELICNQLWSGWLPSPPRRSAV